MLFFWMASSIAGIIFIVVSFLNFLFKHFKYSFNYLHEIFMANLFKQVLVGAGYVAINVAV